MRGTAGHPKRKEACEAIGQHLATVGPSNWEPVLERFPDVSRATFWRWVAEVRNGQYASDKNIAAGMARAEDIVARVEGLKGRAKLAADAAGEAFPDDASPVEIISQQLPATPSPAVLAEHGAVVENNIDFMGRLNQLYSDAEKVRNWALHQDGRIKNPQYFNTSIAQRRSLLETALHAMETVYDLRRMQQFYDLILQEIDRADPETQKRITARLSALNSQHGITINAKL